MANATAQPSKHEVFLSFLRDGWVLLRFDARHPGVRVPAHLKQEPRLVLQYGRDMPVPIVDLEVTEHDVRATLSFARTPHATVVPWEAVYVIACTDGREVLYEEDVPRDLLASLRRSAGDDASGEGQAGPSSSPAPAEAAAEPAAEDAPNPPRKRHLSSVPMPDEEADDEEPGRSGTRRKKPVLKLVK